MNIFRAHGSLEVKVDGRLLVLEGTGPWNLESLHDSGKIAAPIVEPLLGKPWGVIATIHGEPIYVPEAAEKLAQIVRSDKVQGRVASALLVDACNSPQFAKNHIGEIYRAAGETFEFFTDYKQAKHWVMDKIAEADLAYLDVADKMLNNPTRSSEFWYAEI